MRVKNTQEQKQIDNVFLKLIFLLWSFTFGMLKSIYLLLFPWYLQTVNKPAMYQVLDFISQQWPRYFTKNPSGYKITRFIGDFIHHIFLKK